MDVYTNGYSVERGQDTQIGTVLLFSTLGEELITEKSNFLGSPSCFHLTRFRMNN